jgi:hypothetical protein
MAADTIIRFSPMIGGTILMIVCLIALLRNPAALNTFAGLLFFGALPFVVPVLSIFDFKIPGGVEFSGQAATTGQLTEQAAGINARLEDIKAGIADAVLDPVAEQNIGGVAVSSNTVSCVARSVE